MSSASEERLGAVAKVEGAAPAAAHLGGSWTHRLARFCVRPLVRTGVTPNHLTTLRLLTGLGACAALALGDREAEIWGGVLWVLSAFLDRADGELARIGGKTSAWGHTYDYICDTVVTPLFFLAIGAGLRQPFGWPALLLGTVAGGAIVVSNILSEIAERRMAPGRRIHEGAAGFDFDDLLYLLGPAAWLGWMPGILIGAGIGAPVMVVVTWWKLRRLPRAG
ncbi:MAG: CDP-alcohol phosphatidyltransferase family protein [Alphaproteobacteria bacterium]|nr:CDP-alcohol phosphatidyltransferase family protein [Alphaproteobacteria bacterium]